MFTYRSTPVANLSNWVRLPCYIVGWFVLVQIMATGLEKEIRRSTKQRCGKERRSSCSFGVTKTSAYFDYTEQIIMNFNLILSMNIQNNFVFAEIQYHKLCFGKNNEKKWCFYFLIFSYSIMSQDQNYLFHSFLEGLFCAMYYSIPGLKVEWWLIK